MTTLKNIFETFFARYTNINSLFYAFEVDITQNKMMLKKEVIKTVEKDIIFQLFTYGLSDYDKQNDYNKLISSHLDITYYASKPLSSSNISSTDLHLNHIFDIEFRIELTRKFICLFDAFSKPTTSKKLLENIQDKKLIPLFKLANHTNNRGINHLLELHSTDKLLEITIHTLLYLGIPNTNSCYYFNLLQH